MPDACTICQSAPRTHCVRTFSVFAERWETTTKPARGCNLEFCQACAEDVCTRRNAKTLPQTERV